MNRENRPNKPTIADSYRKLYYSAQHAWKKNGGKICTIAGTTGLFLTGLHAARKTYKIHDELVANGERIRKAKQSKSDDKRFSKAWRVTKEVAKCAAKTSRHYVADMVGYGLSAYCAQKGYSIEHTNYQNMVAFSGILAADFLNYRKNVISEHGKDADLRYLTTKKANSKIVDATLSDGTKLINTEKDANGNLEALTIQVDPSLFRIRYSRYTTPSLWSPSHACRIMNLNWVQNELDRQLIYGGQYTVNDVRRYFYGPKGDVGLGGMFGRIFEPGNPEHPEYGAKVNLHFEDDEDFKAGLTDECWIIIDVDPLPLFEREREQQDRHPRFTEVEDV